MVAQTVPYEAFQAEHEKRLQAERERDYYKNEFYLIRNLRRAPVLKPVAKEILQEFRHVEKWGTVKDPEGNTRANYTTIAKHLKISPDTVTIQAERLEKLGLIEIHEHQGPKDACDRKYVHVKEEKLHTIDKLKDTKHIIPQQGGDRYQCQNPNCLSKHVKIKRKTTLVCLDCQHESVISETEQILNAQKQLAFQQSKHTIEQAIEDQKQLAEHSVYTQDDNASQKQLAFDLELTEKPQWVVWRKEMRNGKPTKVPYNPTVTDRAKRADVTNSKTWGTYEQARALEHKFDGIGFVFNGDYVGIDIDTFIDKETGAETDQAREIVALIDSYTERSPSGAGLHIIARGSIPAGRRRNGIEMYHSGRFFTFTGNHLSGTPVTIEDSQNAIDALYELLAPPAPAPISNVSKRNISDCSEQEVLQKARNAKNDAKFLRLYSGDWSGYHSQSEADLALCKKFVYYGASSVSTIDGLFQDSGLMRDKWKNRNDYRMQTIHKALGQNWQVAS